MTPVQAKKIGLQAAHSAIMRTAVTNLPEGTRLLSLRLTAEGVQLEYEHLNSGLVIYRLVQT